MNLFGVLSVTVLFWTAVPDSPVADAAMRGDIETVRSLLERGADVNAAQGDGMTALHWAAERGGGELAQMLIQAGASVRAVTRLGAYTPLHLASKGGYASVVETLLDAGANANAVTTSGGATPLHFGAASGGAKVVTALLSHNASIDARESAWGQTPLMFAAAYNRVEVIDTLLARGADISITSSVVDVPAREESDRVAERRRNERQEALGAVSRGAGVDRQTGRGQPRQGQGAGQQRPTQRPAAQRAARQAVQQPSNEPAEPLSYGDLVGRHGGLTALLHAAREGHVETVMTLLDAGADINLVSGGDRTGPMLIAMINGHFDLALMLLERGADPNLSNDAGTTPLYAVLNTHWAPKSRYPQQHVYQQQQAIYLEVMEALLEAGADPNARLTKHLWYMGFNFDLLRVDTKGATPFWRAAYATDVAAMRLLVARGADPNVATQKVPSRRFRRGGESGPDPSGLPPVPVGGPAVHPIHAASGVGYGEGYAGNAHRHVPDGWLPAVRYLVEELGTDVNARDHNGYSPLHHAAARGDNDLIRYLVQHGADVTAVSRRGQTTADMANGPVQRIQPFPETVALLERLGAKNSHNCVSC